jgi:protocatechuate 3,4-dioxygenase beta subunit
MEGPFYLDLGLVRGDITEGLAGTPLALAITVVEAGSCAPIAGAAVDVWHADPRGEYSGFLAGEDGTTYLRGIQVTDRVGRARFRTVYPGWYPGRSVHVHVKVDRGRTDPSEAAGRIVHTGQLFFPDDLTDRVLRAAPYAARGEPDTRNDDDALFDGAGGPDAIARVAARPAGYGASISVGVAPA